MAQVLRALNDQMAEAARLDAPAVPLVRPAAVAMQRLADDGLVLMEVAPGIDIERDVLDQMDFRPRVAEQVQAMDARLYATGPMGLAADFGTAQ